MGITFFGPGITISAGSGLKMEPTEELLVGAKVGTEGLKPPIETKLNGDVGTLLVDGEAAVVVAGVNVLGWKTGAANVEGQVATSPPRECAETLEALFARGGENIAAAAHGKILSTKFKLCSFNIEFRFRFGVPVTILHIRHCKRGHWALEVNLDLYGCLRCWFEHLHLRSSRARKGCCVAVKKDVGSS